GGPGRVDDGAAVAGDRRPADGLVLLGAGFGVLAGDPPDGQHVPPGAVAQVFAGPLEEEELLAGVGAHLAVDVLDAVADLEDQSARGVEAGELSPQFVDRLPGDEVVLGQGPQVGAEFFAVRPLRLLFGGQAGEPLPFELFEIDDVGFRACGHGFTLRLNVRLRWSGRRG